MMTAPGTGYPRHITISIIQHSITVWKEKRQQKGKEDGKKEAATVTDREETRGVRLIVNFKTFIK